MITMQTRRQTQWLIVAAMGALLAVTPAALAGIINNNNVSGYFTNSAIWVGSVVPGSGDDARIVDNNITVTIDGGDRTVQKLSANKATAAFVLNMNPGATLFTTLNIGGTIVISNGTLQITGSGPTLGGANALLTGGALPASLILSGGNYSQTNNTAFILDAGVAAESTVRVDAGSTFDYKGTTLGASIGNDAGSPTGRKRILFQVNGGTANLTTADGYENIIAGNWNATDATAKMTSVVTVASGTLNVLTNVATPGGPGQRLIVGGRAGLSGNPNSDFDGHFSQLVVSNTGSLNVGGGGVFVGRSASGSGGEFAMYGGTANLNGLHVGDLGRVTQNGGVMTLNAKTAFTNAATDSQRHFYMSGGLTRFENIAANAMTIDMGGASGGNVLGQGLYNVQIGSTGRPPFTVTLPNPLYGCGNASGGNGRLRDGIMDLTVWTNVTVAWNGTNYSGLTGPTSLKAFVGTATTWGWDAEVAPLTPYGSMVMLK
jgi:hypothetical protein